MLKLIKLIKLNRNYCSTMTISKNQNHQPVKLSFISFENNSNDNVAPPLVILHGLFGSKSNWNSLCKAYNKNCKPIRKIVAVDARNHGESPHVGTHTYDELALDLKYLMKDDLNVDKISLIGHSMGGRACMKFALKYPDNVDKLIVADISPTKSSPNFHTMPSIFLALKRIEIPVNVPLSSARFKADQQLKQYIDDKSLRAFLLTNLIQRDNGKYDWRINIDVLLKNFNEIAQFSHDNLTFNGQTLFVGGSQSDFIDKNDHKDILKIFPKAQFSYIEGAGHWLHSENPKEFLNITLKFLNN